MWDRARALVRWVVPLAAAAVAVALIGIVAVTRSEAPHARAAPRPVAATPVAEPERHVREEAPQGPRGTTAFVRRLEIGSDLLGLLSDVEEKGIWGAQFAHKYERIKPFLLQADGKDEKGERPVKTLVRLTDPRRDLSSLILAGEARGDPLGSSMLVRVWTRKEAYPEAELARVTGTVDHIAHAAGRGVQGGIDVLVTERMGRDVFPSQRMNWRAAGLYYVKDKYCAAYSTLPPEFRVEVVKHECVHALHLSLPEASDSRFVAEGLAEYLRLVEPGDDGLRVPAQRLADFLAELQLMLRRLKEAGVAIEKIEPSRLVDLSAKEFYALRHLGYLVAQLTMAYLGGDVIRDALAAGSDAPLVKAARGIHWADFLRFVDEGAVGGKLGRARVVADIDAPASWRTVEVFVDALRATGAGLPERTAGLTPLFTSVRRGAGALEANLAQCFEAVRDPLWTPRIYVDLSSAMDRPVRLSPAPEAVAKALGGEPRGETAREFARQLVGLVGRLRRVEIVGLAAERRAGGPEVLDSVEALDLGALAAGATPAIVVIVVAGDGIAAAAGRPPASFGFAVLVVDLSEDRGGLDLAYLCEEGPLVGYWRPLADR